MVYQKKITPDQIYIIHFELQNKKNKNLKKIKKNMNYTRPPFTINKSKLSFFAN